MKYTIPDAGYYFITTTIVDGDRNKKCKDLYRLSKDSFGLMVHPLAHLIESFQSDKSLFPFEVDLGWFKSKEIEIITPMEAKEIIRREEIVTQIIKQHDQYFIHCNMYKFDWQADASPVIPVHHGDEVLRLAKLKQPVFLRLNTKGYTHITHISNTGELVINLKDNFKHINHQSVNASYLEIFAQNVEKTGFSDRLEAHLVSRDRQALLRKPQVRRENEIFLSNR